MEPYLDIIARSASVYLFLVVALRIFGRKELSQLSTTDLVFIILISNSVQNAMVGSNSSLLGGIAAATSLFVLNYAFKMMLFKNKRFKTLVEDKPVILIHNGVVDRDHLARVRLSEEELDEALREHGVDELSQVKFAVLEVDGNISVVSRQGDAWKQTHYKRRRNHKSIINAS